MADDRDTPGADEELDEEKEGAGSSAEDAFEDELAETITDALDPDADEDDDEEDLDDDDDDDDDLFDDEDDEDDEEEDDEDPAQPRDEKGKFAPKAGDKPADAAAGDKAGEKPAAGAPAAGDGKPAAAANPTAPKWEPFSVTANKETVPIEGVNMSKANGHVFLAMPDAAYARFQSRVSRGVVAEKMWRQLQDGIKEVEARKAAPAPKSDLEIEAEVTLEMIKPHLADILDDDKLELLEAKIEAAKSKYQGEYTKSEETRLAKATEPTWEEQQVDGMLSSMIGLVSHHPELAALKDKPELLEEVYQREFLPIRNALVFREGDDAFVNTEVMFDRLKARAIAIAATAAAPAPKETPKGNSSSTATKPASKADRFNRGVDAGKKPASTNVKANRAKRLSDKEHTRRRTKRDTRRSKSEEAADAEEDWRKTERAYMSSDSLDFDVKDDEE